MPATSHLDITPRDVSILEMIHAFHGCSAQHVHDRFWVAETSLSATYRRIARLRAEQYVRAHRLPSLSGQGSGRALLLLAGKGRRVIAECHQVPLSQVPRQKFTESSIFTLHHFAICDFRVALELASAELGNRLTVSWTGEWSLRQAPMRVEDAQSANGSEPRTITLIPDGAFSLTYNGRRQDGFLEMDMATLSPKRLRAKLRGYLLQQSAVPTPIFFVTESERRAALITDITVTEATRLGADASRLFVSVRDRLSSTTILTQPVWRQAGVGRPLALLPNPSTAAPRNDGLSPLTESTLRPVFRRAR